jgi:signal transduction histidine kinase
VEKLINLIKMESGRQALERELVTIESVVDDAISSLKSTLLEEEVSIEVSIEDHLAVVGDLPALSKAVANLLGNAWKYTDAGDREIKVVGLSEGKWAILEVSDNGPGISKTDQGQIFEKFHRGEAAGASGAQGSGLGLALVRAIVGVHNGKVELHSRPGHGATFRIKLRRA